MKNRFYALLMVLLLVLSLCACAGDPADKKNPDEQTNVSTDSNGTVSDDTSKNDEISGDEQDQAAASDDLPSSDVDEGDTEEQKPVVLADVRSAMIEKMGISDPLELESEMLVDLYGITAEMLAQSASFVTMAGTFPDEVILTEAVDEAAADAVEVALQKRLDEVLVQSKTYDAENYAAAQECKVVRNGLFVALILSPKQADMSVIYQSYFPQ